MLPRNHPLRRFGLSRLAGALGITHGAISQWRRVPAERVLAVARITGLPRHQLRPDLFLEDRSCPPDLLDRVPAVTFSALEQRVNNFDGSEAGS